MRTLVLMVCSAGAALSGQTAPALVLERTIPAGVEIGKGRPVVLEFWATWCANCIAEIPHWNALAAKFPDVQFLSISDEPFAVVEPFLGKQRIAGVVGIDRDGATFKAYGIEGRPQTVLIDAAGIVRGKMHPRQVDEMALADLVAGRELKPAGLPSRLQMLRDATSDPVFAVMLRPSSNPKPGGTLSPSPGRLEGTNLFLKVILSVAYGVGERVIEGPETLLATRYDYCVLLPNGGTGDVELLRQMVERSFKLKVRREARTMDAVVVKARGPLTGRDRMSTLLRILEWRLKRPIVDETGSESYTHFELPQNADELAQALRTKLGIELVYETRPVEKLIIESMELPTYRMR